LQLEGDGIVVDMSQQVGPLLTYHVEHLQVEEGAREGCILFCDFVRLDHVDQAVDVRRHVIPIKTSGHRRSTHHVLDAVVHVVQPPQRDNHTRVVATDPGHGELILDSSKHIEMFRLFDERKSFSQLGQNVFEQERK